MVDKEALKDDKNASDVDGEALKDDIEAVKGIIIIIVFL